jgi:hypothetical protein
MHNTLIKKYNIDSQKRATVVHNDVHSFNIDAKKVKKTDEGYLTGEAPVAKVGVMTYLMADGTILREFVPPEVLFEQESMDSFKFKPVTDDHPYDKRVNADNAGYRSVGAVGETITRDKDYLKVSFVVMDGSTVTRVDNGKQELSPGYSCELVFQSGNYDGQDYDAIQLSRRYNHLAIVDNARGGTDIRMKLDKCDGFEISNNIVKEQSMKFNIDGIEYDAAPEVVNFIKKIQANADGMKIELTDSKKSVDTVSAERDTLKSKVDSFEKKDNKAEIAAAVKARISLERLVVDSIGEVENIDSLDSRELKLKVIEDRFPDVSKKINKDTSNDYIDSAFDIAVATESNLDAQVGAMNTPVVKKENTDARQRMIDDLKTPKDK